MGFNYVRVNDKKEYLLNLKDITSAKITEKPMIVELIVDSEDEDMALNLIGSIMVDDSNLAKVAIKKAIGKKGINAIKKMVRR